MRRRQCETALGLLVLAALVSVDSRTLSKSSDGSKWKRAISISNGGTAPNSSNSQKPRSANATSDQISAKKVRLSDLTVERGGGYGDGDPSRSISIVTQTLLTFVTVFFLGCAIVLAIFAWKRFSDSPFR